VRSLRLGTRGSRLARWQAEWLRGRLAAQGASSDIVIIETRGDAEVDRPLQQLEGKGFFTKEIEEALLEDRIDVAVHSMKDLPTVLPAGLELGPVPERADPADVLVVRAAGVTSLAQLPARARLGTSSLRRIAQVAFLRPDLEIVSLRGNVPTRVEKVKTGGALDAALLAFAGLSRLGLERAVAARLDPLEVMPAPGQGALGLELRAGDRIVREALRPLEHAPSAQAVAAERAMLAALGGGCQAAVAAYTGNRETGNGKRLFGRVLAVDGAVQLTASVDVDPARPAAAGEDLARLLEAHGALELLAR
jgi:hydroxymethylbilane synthase